MTAIEEEKYRLRKRMEKRRKEMSDEEQRLKSRQAIAHLLKHPLFADPAKVKGLTVCTYMPFRSELDITPFMEWCWQQGVTTLIPKANRLSETLHIRVIKSYADVETGNWGIREPRDSAPSWDTKSPIDMVLVPGLAFDLQGGRVGYGGGYYDHFIRDVKRNTAVKPAIVAVAFDLQIVEQVPMEKHDLRVDAVITESLHTF